MGDLPWKFLAVDLTDLQAVVGCGLAIYPHMTFNDLPCYVLHLQSRPLADGQAPETNHTFVLHFEEVAVLLAQAMVSAEVNCVGGALIAAMDQLRAGVRQHDGGRIVCLDHKGEPCQHDEDEPRHD